MKATHRKTLYIDRNIQRPLAVRVATYWMLCLLAIFALVACYPLAISWCLPLKNTPTSGELFARTWSMFWPAFVSAILILPAVVWDVLRMSNRFVGPIYRMRRVMDDVLDGKPAKPIQLRKGDHLIEFVEKFNQLTALVQANDQSTVKVDRQVVDSEEELVEALV